MRYQEAHAAKSGSVPFTLRGRKSMRRLLSTALAGVIGLAPAILVSSPAMAVAGDITISAASGAEGGLITFTISRDNTGATSLGEVTLNWTTGGGNATATADYTPVTAGTVTLPAYTSAAPQTRTISVQTATDSIDEANETFQVTLTGTGVVTTGSANVVNGTILDDDDPTFTLSSTTVSEGTASSTITANLSSPAVGTVTIPVSTADDTAKAGQDYTETNATITIGNGASSGSTTVAITDDTADEDDVQSFWVRSSAGTNVAGTQSVKVNIQDNDAPPTITVGGAQTGTEGQALTFPLSLTAASEKTVTANWETANGTALAGSDYTAVTGGTVSFTPGQTNPTNPVRVNTLSDESDEGAETFKVKFSGATNGTLSAAEQTGTINDSGSTLPPQVQLVETAVTEGGKTATRARTFTVKLTKASGQTQAVGYTIATGGGSPATDTVDFTAAAKRVLTFAPGETEKTFTVDVMGDDIDEGTGETFLITLNDENTNRLQSGLNLAANVITITDDDAKPTISLQSDEIRMPEGNGYSAALLQVNLSNPTSQTVDWSIAAASDPGTATEALSGVGTDDYDNITTLGSQTAIAAGATSAYVLVLIKGDTVHENDETARFTISLGNSETDATGGPLTGTITLTNDDAAPSVKITSAAANEGDTVALKGTVSNVSVFDTLLNVTLGGFAANGNRAAGPADFSPTSFPVRVAAGTASGSTVNIGDVMIVNDAEAEPAESIGVGGTGFGGVGAVEGGSITIAASDGGTTPPPGGGEEPGGEEPGGEEPGGEEPGGEPGSPSISASDTSLEGAGSVRITGKADPNTTVVLWGHAIGATGEGMELQDTESDEEGNYSFTQAVSRGMVFQAAVGELFSREVQVTVAQKPGFSAASTTRGKLTLRVSANPRGAAGQAVVIQRLEGGKWVNAYRGVTNATGGYVSTVSVRSGTKWTLRALVAPSAATGVQQGTSANATVTVR